MVGNNWRKDEPRADSVQAHKSVLSMVMSAPVRVACIHYLLNVDHYKIQMGMKEALKTLDHKTTVRFKPHYGSIPELKLQLLSGKSALRIQPKD